MRLLLSFKSRDSVVVDSLFVVAPIVCVGFVLGPCFVMWFIVSFLVLPSSCCQRKRELIALLKHG